MLDEDLWDIVDLTHSPQIEINLESFVFKHALPGIGLIACKVIQGMVSCYNHEGYQPHILDFCLF
jgi:hypothetical protein